MLICPHSFRREISTEKMGITSGQRCMCLERLQQMACSLSEKYMDIYLEFISCAPSIAVEYFDENWHPMRKQWTMGMK